jgi:hypothetical protein
VNMFFLDLACGGCWRESRSSFVSSHSHENSSFLSDSIRFKISFNFCVEVTILLNRSWNTYLIALMVSSFLAEDQILTQPLPCTKVLNISTILHSLYIIQQKREPELTLWHQIPSLKITQNTRVWTQSIGCWFRPIVVATTSPFLASVRDFNCFR